MHWRTFGLTLTGGVGGDIVARLSDGRVSAAIGLSLALVTAMGFGLLQGWLSRKRERS